MTKFITPPFANVPTNERKMPAKKKQSKTLQPAPPTTASDYDTDTAYYTEHQQQLPLAAPTQRSASELNMLVLKRWYPDLESIIAIAPFAVLYSFSPDTQQWDKCDTQGSLFVCQLSSSLEVSSPRFRVIILNRRNPKNFELDLVSTEDIEVTEEFVIIPFMDVETGSPQIYGIWVFKDADSDVNMREYIAAVIMECARLAEQAAADQVYDEQYDDEEEIEQRDTVTNLHESDGTSTTMQHENIPMSSTGQSIDLATLFKRPTQSDHEAPIAFPKAGNEHQFRPQHFFHTTDNAFQRETNSQVTAYPTGQLPVQPGTQQNALLDLFRNAKKS